MVPSGTYIIYMITKIFIERILNFLLFFIEQSYNDDNIEIKLTLFLLATTHHKGKQFLQKRKTFI